MVGSTPLQHQPPGELLPRSSSWALPAPRPLARFPGLMIALLRAGPTNELLPGGALLEPFPYELLTSLLQLL